MLLANAEIGGLLQNRSILDPYITEWLSPELSITDGMNGAAGVRQAGRLLLFTKINQVVGAIDKKIKTLSVGTSKKLMVFLLTGLSGEQEAARSLILLISCAGLLNATTARPVLTG